MDSYADADGSIAERMRQLGMLSRVGAPITVGEHLWGMAVVGSSHPEPLPAGTGQRIAEFAELVATAITAAAARDELIKSRGRIVAAGDVTRRQLERNLHDGAQQHAVSLGLQLRLAETSVPDELPGLKGQLLQICKGLAGLVEELREISSGLHPAILSTGGLRPAIKALARRSTMPVTVDVGFQQRLPESVEVAAYYVVAESLTNAAKHAQASSVTVTARADGERLYLIVRDDGVGGATSGKGSGLIGLKDRVEALGGRLTVSSQVGSGTTLNAIVPLRQP
jgi:signal transduction histidine kinase